MPRPTPVWWSDRNWRSSLWLPLAGLYALIARLRRLAYLAGWLHREAPPVPLIVIGNLAAGGSGKTPVVLWLTAALRARGWRPAILSRGYGGRLAGPAPVMADSGAADVGDEPVLLARRSGVPVWIGRDRTAVARALCAAHPDVNVLVSDDGLQHYRLARQVEIVVIDEAVLGNRCPLPAGPMREPLSRAREAQLVILHGPCSSAVRDAIGSVPQVSMSLQAGRFYRLGDPSQTTDALSLRALRLKAVAGIGRPERFFDTLRALGLSVEDQRAFPDHHPFASADLALAGAEALLMTEKDAIKCLGIAPPETWVLPVDALIDPAALDHILEPLHGPQAA